MDYKDHVLQKNNEGHFWYEARKVLIKNLFSSLSKSKENKIKILDVGCGTGSELKIIASFGELTALDINEKALDIARKNGYQVMNLDIQKEGLEEDYYDIVSSFDVLEHLNEDYSAIANIYKSLKKEGYFLFTVPAHPSIFSQHDIALEHKRRYTKKSLREKLEAEGFYDVELYYWNSFLFPLVYLFRLIKKIFLKNIKLGSEAKQRNKFINKFLFLILKFEAKVFFKRSWMPGLSIYGVAKK